MKSTVVVSLIASILLSACGSSEPPPPPPPPPASTVRNQMQPVSLEGVTKYAAIFEEACLDDLPGFTNAPRVFERHGYKGIDLQTAFDGTSVASIRPGRDCFVDFKWDDRELLFSLVKEMAGRSDLTFTQIKGQRALAGRLPGGVEILLIGTRSNKSDISSFGITLR